MLISNELKSEIEQEFASRVQHLGIRLSLLVTAKIERIENHDQRLAMKFLYAHLPLSDLGEEQIFDVLYSTTQHSFKVRDIMPWGKQISAQTFLSDVLMPRIGTEKLEDNRVLFYNMLEERTRGMSMYEAVISTNYFCFEQATYQATDRRTLAPSSMIKSGYGRCGEEAAFTVCALRSLCIPARTVFTPAWAHTDNNHAWVEAWVEGKWHYLGACEPEPILGRGWFTSAASRAMFIGSRTFYKGKSTEESVPNGLIYDVNLTANYAMTQKITVKIVDGQNKAVENANVFFQILNHARFTTINKIVSDKSGEVCLTLGLGSLMIVVEKNGSYCENIFDTRQKNEFVICFEPKNFESSITNFDFYAPKDPANKVKKLSKEVVKNHSKKLKEIALIRQNRLAAYTEKYWAIVAEKAASDKELLNEIIFKSKGNGGEILKFLYKNENPLAIKMLSTLSDKDYVDVSEAVLTAHLAHSCKFFAFSELPEDIFVNYLLAPRIYFEHLTADRFFLYEYFSDNQRTDFAADPRKIWQYIDEEIKYHSYNEYPVLNANTFSTLEIRQGSQMSKKILFVAICRAIGVPARLTHDTLDIEYYFGDRFVSPIPAQTRDCGLTLNFQEGVNWNYGANWSLSVEVNGIFENLTLTSNNNAQMNLELKSGNYRIITANRLPSGDQFATKQDFALIAGEKKSISLSLRKIEPKDMLNEIELADFDVTDKNQNETSASNVLTAGINLILWLNENHEPTNHILTEMILDRAKYKESGVNILIILRDQTAVEDETIAKFIDTLSPKIVFDENFASQEPSARMLFVNPEQLPLVCVTKTGLNSVFAASGYQVGSGTMLLQIINMLKKI